jgi:branched-chain amino acid transport system permease protein
LEVVGQLFLSGLSMGAIYALLALSFVLVIKAVNFVNFAQGDFIMLPAYFAVTVLGLYGMTFSILTALVGGMVVGGILFYYAVYKPLQHASPMMIIAATIGVDLILRNSVQGVWGPNPVSFPELINANIQIGSLYIEPQKLLILIIALVVMVAQYFLFEKTSLGRQMRATAQDRKMAEAFGIHTSRMILLTIVMAAIIAAIAGIIVAPVATVSPSMGWDMSLQAFAAIIIGGFDSVPGAIVGGLLIGLFNAFDSMYVSTLYSNAILFGCVIIFLVVCPNGIFGEKVGIKV